MPRRDYLGRVARGAVAPVLNSTAALPSSQSPQRTGVAADGTWVPLVFGARIVSSAIYDQVRGRMLVFGGQDDVSYHNDVWALSLERGPIWNALPTSGSPPSARWGSAAIYDPVRDRLIVFGGYDDTGDRNDVWALSLSGTPTWTQLAPSGTAPTPRNNATATYDPVRDRILLFAGNGPTLDNDTWALSLAGTPTWTQLTPSGGPPPARDSHTAIFDPARDRMVIFGGYDGNIQPLSDVWELAFAGSPTWHQLTTSGAAMPGRFSHSAIYDAPRDRMIVFGGFSGVLADAYLNDVWTLSLAGTPTWSALSPGGSPPSPRSDHVAIYDPAHDRMLMYGGSGGTSPLGDLWELSLTGATGWGLLAPPILVPTGRASHTAIFDPVRDRMVVFGGFYIDFSDFSFHYLSEIWTLSFLGRPAWTRPVAYGGSPAARALASAIYDPVRDRMIVFGGFFSGTTDDWFNDAWALSLADPPVWSVLTPTGTPPTARNSHSAIYDPVQDRMIVFGGQLNSGPDNNEVWALTLAGAPAWTQLAPTGTPPSPRDEHEAIYDPVHDRMLVFGGYCAGTASFLNDVWALSLSGTPAWTQLAPTGTPPSPRAGCSEAYDPTRSRMLVFGGSYHDDTSDQFFDDLHSLSLSGTPDWSSLEPDGPRPGPRASLTTIYDPVRRRVVLFGGASGSGYFNDVSALLLDGAADVGVSATQVSMSYLRAPVPNPSFGTTTVTYSIPQAGRVQLGVYDMSGRLVRTLVDGQRVAGTGTAAWNGANESGVRQEPGVYFVRLEGPGVRVTRRAVLLH